MSVKGDLRRAFRQRRRDKINRAAADAAIARRVLDSSAYGQARVLLGYAALPEEIQTDGVLRLALAEGKALYCLAVWTMPGKWPFTGCRRWKIWKAAASVYGSRL